MRGDAFLIACEIHAVGGFHGGIKGMVGGAQGGGHVVRVVKLGEGGAGKVATLLIYNPCIGTHYSQKAEHDTGNDWAIDGRRGIAAA